MTVYVDDMYRKPRGQVGRMRMSHLIADTEDELHDMADRIGVARQWHQGDHYDISKVSRDRAIAAGTVAITLRECASMYLRRKVTGSLGLPHDAEAWARNYLLGRCRDRAAEIAGHV